MLGVTVWGGWSRPLFNNTEGSLTGRDKPAFSPFAKEHPLRSLNTGWSAGCYQPAGGRNNSSVPSRITGGMPSACREPLDRNDKNEQTGGDGSVKPGHNRPDQSWGGSECSEGRGGGPRSLLGFPPPWVDSSSSFIHLKNPPWFGVRGLGTTGGGVLAFRAGPALGERRPGKHRPWWVGSPGGKPSLALIFLQMPSDWGSGELD